jgi:hypothetical protein
MILHIAMALLAILLLYYWMTMKPKNFPPGKVHSSQCRDSLRIGRSGVRIPMGSGFSALAQTGRGTHPAFCTVGYRVSFPGVKWPGRGVNHPYPLVAPRLKKEKGYASTPLWAFMAFYKANFTSRSALWMEIYYHIGA